MGISALLHVNVRVTKVKHFVALQLKRVMKSSVFAIVNKEIKKNRHVNSSSGGLYCLSTLR